MTLAECEHDWRRGPSDAIGRFHATVCVNCAAISTGRDWQMPTPSIAEVVRIESLLPPPTPTPRPTLRTRFRWWRQTQRTRLASVIAGFDVTA